MPGKPRHLAFRGKTQSIAAWARELAGQGFTESLISNRLHLGWSEEKTLSTPPLVRFRPKQPAPRAPRIPPLLEHKESGQARLWWRGRYRYLGPIGSAEAARAYAKAVEAIARTGSLPLEGGGGVTVAELLLRFLAFAEGYYVKRGRPTSEVYCYRAVARVLEELHGDLPAAEFGPGHLKEARVRFLAFPGVRGKPWSRRHVNFQVYRVRRVWGWAVEEGLVPAVALLALQQVRALRKGKTQAAEQKKVPPVKPSAA
jgi:hypothetical protein